MKVNKNGVFYLDQSYKQGYIFHKLENLQKQFQESFNTFSKELSDEVVRYTSEEVFNNENVSDAKLFDVTLTKGFQFHPIVVYLEPQLQLLRWKIVPTVETVLRPRSFHTTIFFKLHRSMGTVNNGIIASDCMVIKIPKFIPDYKFNIFGNINSEVSLSWDVGMVVEKSLYAGSVNFREVGPLDSELEK